MTADLIARLEAAERGSRELDGEIATLIGWKEILAECWEAPDEACSLWHHPPTFTTSIDAIAALTAEKLPGWSVSSALSQSHARANVWRMSPISRGSFPPKHATAKTEPLARCIALLRALERIER